MDHRPKACKQIERDIETKRRIYIENCIADAMIRKCPTCQKPYVAFETWLFGWINIFKTELSWLTAVTRCNVRVAQSFAIFAMFKSTTIVIFGNVTSYNYVEIEFIESKVYINL